MHRKTSYQGKRPAWLNRELGLELWEKKRIYRLWKEGQAIWEDHKGVGRSCRDKIRRTKTQLELGLACSSNNKKKFL